MKKHYKFILGIVIGLIISGVVGYAQTVLTSKEVVYDNTNSKLSSTNVKDAIDEVNTKATKKVEEAKKECPDGYVCRVNQFARDSWATIAANVKAGNAGAYQVGDTKEIDMGSLGTHTVRVANTSSCTNGETNFTSSDKLYLLSIKEVWNDGTGYATAEAETKQLDYYKSKGVTPQNASEAIKQYNGSLIGGGYVGLQPLLLTPFTV